MRVLSIKQPWAWLIVNGFKDIENRDWITRERGRILIQASQSCTRKEYAEAVAFVASVDPQINVPLLGSLSRGGIVGSVEIVDCIQESDSPWFFGNHGFVLQNAEVLEFELATGQLGFFEYSGGQYKYVGDCPDVCWQKQGYNCWNLFKDGESLGFIILSDIVDAEFIPAPEVGYLSVKGFGSSVAYEIARRLAEVDRTGGMEL